MTGNRKRTITRHVDHVPSVNPGIVTKGTSRHSWRTHTRIQGGINKPPLRCGIIETGVDGVRRDCVNHTIDVSVTELVHLFCDLIGRGDVLHSGIEEFFFDFRVPLNNDAAMETADRVFEIVKSYFELVNGQCCAVVMVTAKEICELHNLPE